MNVTELLEMAHGNMAVFDSIAKAHHVLSTHENISVSISGGSDSDVVLDLIWNVNQTTQKNIRWVWFDTGLEYQATKRHLEFLEKKYNITIERQKAVKPIPLSCRQHGQPFLNKFVSEQMGRLQKNGFQWEDEPLEVLCSKYPNCKSALKWWCNQYTIDNGFEKVSRFDIGYNKHLKEFIIANPPQFNIANKCCTYAKKNVSKKFIKENGIDCMIIGIRRAEGGIRSTVYKNCFNHCKSVCDNYRPIFWYSDQDKIDYERAFGVTHSDCYVKYGMVRTGCAGCPFNRKFEDEKHTIETFEPKLYGAINKIFGDSYEYTRKYKQFCLEQKEKESQIDGQISICDLLEQQ